MKRPPTTPTARLWHRRPPGGAAPLALLLQREGWSVAGVFRGDPLPFSRRDSETLERLDAVGAVLPAE
jgi:hypothetical protein